MAEKPRTDPAYSSDVILAIGMLSVRGDLRNITVPNKDKDTQLHSVCPDCAEPKEFMGAALVCRELPLKHGPFGKAEIKYGKEVDGKIVIVDAEAAKEARASQLPEKALSVQVHKREEVAGHTFPMGNAYVFTPRGDTKFYTVLVELIKKRGDLVFLAKSNLHNSDHFIQLDVEMNDQLVIRDMVWPEDIKTFDAVAAPDITAADRAKLLKQAETLVEVSIEDFDVSDYTKDKKVRLAQAIADAASGATVTPVSPKKAAKAKVEDLSAALEAAIQAAQAKKAS